MYQSLEDDPYGPGRLASEVARRPADDTLRSKKQGSASQSNVRNKSSVPKRVTESETVERENPFSTNNNATNLKLLGFENDFLGFGPGPGQGNPATREDIKAAQNNPYENLDEIDFRTNPGGAPPGPSPANHYYPAFDVPSFGNFEKKPSAKPNGPPKSKEVNLLD